MAFLLFRKRRHKTFRALVRVRLRKMYPLSYGYSFLKMLTIRKARAVNYRLANTYTNTEVVSWYIREMVAVSPFRWPFRYDSVIGNRRITLMILRHVRNIIARIIMPMIRSIKRANRLVYSVRKILKRYCRFGANIVINYMEDSSAFSRVTTCRYKAFVEA